jgi:hypothetical protein
MTTRRSKVIPKTKLAQLKKALSPYGSKTHLSRETKLSTQTIHNILNAGAGLEQHVNAIYAYFENNTAA